MTPVSYRGREGAEAEFSHKEGGKQDDRGEAVAAIREIVSSEGLRSVIVPYLSLVYLTPTPNSTRPLLGSIRAENVSQEFHAQQTQMTGLHWKGVTPHRRWRRDLPVV